MFGSPREIAFCIFNIPVHFYGIVMAVSMIFGVFFSKFICKKYYPELNPENIYSIAPIIIVSAILGARIYYCLLCYNYFSQNISEIFQIWHGGMSIQGGIMGGILGGIVYAKKHSFPILKYCDIFSYGLVLGQIIGRWGNFFNSEAFGIPCSNDFFLKLFIPISKRPLEYIEFNYFHPTFLYESLLNCIVLAILLLALRVKNKLKPGTIFFAYLIMYSIVRIFIEIIRIDSVLNVLNIPIAIIICIISILISVTTIFVIYAKHKNI